MSLIKILLLNDNVRVSGAVPVIWSEDHRSIFLDRVRARSYVTVSKFEIPYSGEEAAEEVYDITNSPTRVDECAQVAGHIRPVLPGDIVVVDSRMYGCLSIGWVDLGLEISPSL